eukprot:scaffold91128_cov35-Phaeocystis_antarctica.AAC.2
MAHDATLLVEAHAFTHGHQVRLGQEEVRARRPEAAVLANRATKQLVPPHNVNGAANRAQVDELHGRVQLPARVVGADVPVVAALFSEADDGPLVGHAEPDGNGLGAQLEQDAVAEHGANVPQDDHAAQVGILLCRVHVLAFKVHGVSGREEGKQPHCRTEGGADSGHEEAVQHEDAGRRGALAGVGFGAVKDVAEGLDGVGAARVGDARDGGGVWHVVVVLVVLVARVQHDAVATDGANSGAAARHGVALNDAARQQHAAVGHVGTGRKGHRRVALAVAAKHVAARAEDDVVTNSEQVELDDLELDTRPEDALAHVDAEQAQRPRDAEVVLAEHGVDAAERAILGNELLREPVLEVLPLALGASTEAADDDALHEDYREELEPGRDDAARGDGEQERHQPPRGDEPHRALRPLGNERC